MAGLPGVTQWRVQPRSSPTVAGAVVDLQANLRTTFPFHRTSVRTEAKPFRRAFCHRVNRDLLLRMVRISLDFLRIVLIIIRNWLHMV